MPDKAAVVAAIIENNRGEILLTSRPADKFMAGYWEFPGGKVEVGESLHQALVRELYEEIGIEVLASAPWLTQRVVREDGAFPLFFRRVRAHEWQGMPMACEKQQLLWCAPDAIHCTPRLPSTDYLLPFLCLPRLFSMDGRGIFIESGHYVARKPDADARVALPCLLMSGSDANHPARRQRYWQWVAAVEDYQYAADAEVLVWDARFCPAWIQDILQQGVSRPILMAITARQDVEYWWQQGAHGCVWLASGFDDAVV